MSATEQETRVADPEQAQAPAQPHGEYPPPYGRYAPQTTNGFAIASLVLGIAWAWWIGSVLALVFGYISLAQIDRSRGAETGRGFAIAGIVLGWVGVGSLALLFLLGFFGVFGMWDMM